MKKIIYYKQRTEKEEQCMGRITVSQTQDYFIKDQKPFFYLGDTIWMAFSKLTIEKWKQYLCYRKTQGFTVIQASLFPLCHDNSISEKELFPFGRIPETGQCQFNRMVQEYFDQVEAFLSAAYEMGMTVCLHLLWVNYIPNTWASQSSPGTGIPYEQLESIYRPLLRRYRKYQPVYAVSGDIRFESPEVERYCLKMLDMIAEEDAEALTTLHIAPDEDLPDSIVRHRQLGFYTYQSGHGFMQQDNTYRFARQFLAKDYKKPIVNTEPGYEGHRHGYRNGRFDRFDIRKETYLSLLGGAKAGITYGAHGVWMCHEREMQFNNERFSGSPFPFETALRFDGAWDVSFAKRLYQFYGMQDMEPLDNALTDDLPDVLAAENKSRGLIFIYTPYNTRLSLSFSITDYDVEAVVLKTRDFITPDCNCENNTIAPHEFNSDALYVLRKRGLISNG